MKKMWLLTLVLAIAMPVLLNGCVVARDINALGMDPKSQEKFADQIACKVVEKLKENGCPKMAEAAEPNKPCK